MDFSTNESFALELDQSDPIKHCREQFVIPNDTIYFAGHSLGLMPKTVKTAIEQELDDWGKHAVEGHFVAKNPWLPYHENLTHKLAKLVGAKPIEVVAMNTLTVNLHLMLVSFYRPTKSRNKILIENNTFPSDKYAVDSQARFHGFDPKKTIVELRPDDEKITVSEDSLLDQIEKLGEELELVMLGNVNYLSGQYFDIPKIVQAARKVGAKVGFNLAHGAGNLQLKLHEWDVDFAVWCSYKYLNSGPGALAGAFIHEKHATAKLPRFEGWWGHDKKSRFKMGPNFEPIPGAEGWQLSNPPIFQLAAMNASLEIFDHIGMEALSAKSAQLNKYMEQLLLELCPDICEIVTPEKRGSMLCLKFMQNAPQIYEELKSKDVICDFREPNIIRATPVASYTRFIDVFRFVQIIKDSKS